MTKEIKTFLIDKHNHLSIRQDSVTVTTTREKLFSFFPSFFNELNSFLKIFHHLVILLFSFIAKIGNWTNCGDASFCVCMYLCETEMEIRWSDTVERLGALAPRAAALCGDAVLSLRHRVAQFC